MSLSDLESESECEPLVRRRARRIAGSVWTLDIMVVEDDAADSTLILDVLRRNANVRQVWGYEDPEKALESLAQKRALPDLILLDVRMPKLTGFDFIARLRETLTYAVPQIVLLTTSSLARDVERANKADVCEYVIKPDTYDELRERLDKTVQRALKRAHERP